MMNFLSAQLLLEILMIFVQIVGKTKFQIQQEICQGKDSFTSSVGYTQIIEKPTHVTNISMLCIDVIIFTNQNIN